MGKSIRALGAVVLAFALLQLGPLPGSVRPADADQAASSSLRIDGAVARPATYGLQDLRRKPPTTLTVYFNTGTGPVTASFTGVLLWTLLQEAGVRTDPAVRNEILRRTVRLVAADGYEIVLGAGEIAPQFGGEQAIVAYARDGKPLPEEQGFARLIVPGDKAGGRNIFGLVRIEVQ